MRKRITYNVERIKYGEVLNQRYTLYVIRYTQSFGACE